MRRVLIITFAFPPSREVGAQACNQIVRHLPLYAWEPVVLTVQEPYIEEMNVWTEQVFPSCVVRTRVLPHPLSIYRSLKSTIRFKAGGNERIGESFRKIGVLRRWVLSLLMMPDRDTGWILPATISGLRVIRRQKVKHLFSSGPFWTNHLIGLILSRLSRLPWTAHFRDPWNHVQKWKPVSRVSEHLERALEKMVVRRATSVVCVTEYHTNLLREIYSDLPSDKFVTIPNGFDGAEWDEAELGNNRKEPVRKDKFVVTYAGTLYRQRSPLPLFRALKRLVDSGEVRRDQVRIQLVGLCDTVEGRSVKEMATQCGLDGCVTFRGFLSRRETLWELTRSDLLLLLAEDWTLQIPAKTYEYLRSSRPILALTSEGALADLLRRTGGGWVVDPRDEDGIVAAVRDAYLAWRDGLALPTSNWAVVTDFDRRLLAGRFAEVFNAGSREAAEKTVCSPGVKQHRRTRRDEKIV